MENVKSMTKEDCELSVRTVRQFGPLQIINDGEEVVFRFDLGFQIWQLVFWG